MKFETRVALVKDTALLLRQVQEDMQRELGLKHLALPQVVYRLCMNYIKSREH